jgi:hypothetical protein
MSERDDNLLARWLDAEEKSGPDEADQLFSLVAATHLRRIDAPRRLADQVMAALPARAAAPARRFVDLAGARWVRFCAAMSVALLGVALALVTPGHLLDLGIKALAVAGHALADLATSLSVAVGVWKASVDLMGTLGQTAGRLATSGLMPMVIAANVAVAGASFAGLKRLLTPPEECA